MSSSPDTEASTSNSTPGPEFLGLFLTSIIISVIIIVWGLCRRIPQAQERPGANEGQLSLSFEESGIQLPPTAAADSVSQCTVCMQELVGPRCPVRQPTQRCTHAIDICNECLQTYIQVKVETAAPTGPTCPNLECRQPLAFHDIKEFARPETFTRYQELLLRQELGNVPNFFFCKNPRCEFGQYQTNIPRSNMVVCRQCGSKTCVKHDIPWHEGLTCSQYDDSQTEGAAREWMRKKTKRSPHCRVPIEKNAGCDHMTCTRCYTRFNWSNQQWG